MSATICDDTWNVLNMQHIIPNSKRWDYSDIPGGGHKKIKGPVHVVEGGHHLRKAPNPTSLQDVYVTKKAERGNYRKTSNLRCTKSQNLNDSRLVLQLSLPNPLKLDVRLRMKM